MSDKPPLAVRVTDSWYQVPRRYDVIWISRRKPLPWYETTMWARYMSIVSDLLSAGF